jgi:site-specific recombinase XerD
MSTNKPCVLYLQRLAVSGRKAMLSQLNMIRVKLNWPKPTIEQPFHTLNYLQLESLKQQMILDGKSARTINHMLQCVRGITKVAYILELIDHKALTQIEAVKTVKTTPYQNGQALSGKMVIKLLQTCNQETTQIDKRNTALLAIFLTSGLRRTEISKLKLSDYNKNSKTLRVISGKGNKPRVQHLPEWISPYINHWLKLRGEQEGYLFNPLLRTKIPVLKPLSPSAIYHVVTTKTESLVGTRCTPHDLRRTYITELLNQNVDLITTSKMAGHANVTTTQIYDKRGESALISAANKINFD